MTRIRLALLAAAVGLFVPVVMLAWRALDGLALERAVRHQALAERAFDEMERALSDWLAAEEARPFEEYRFYPISPGQRSPLADPPALDFVVGAFQLDPDGSLRTPLRPSDPDELALARARGDWPPAPGVEERIERIAQLVGRWRDERAPAGGETAGRELRDATGVATDAHAKAEPSAPAAGGKLQAQAPGTTRPLGGVLAEAARQDAASADLAEEDAALGDDSASVYQAFGRLNTGAEQRAARKQKIEEVVIATAEPAAAPSFASPPAPAPPSEPRRAAEPEAFEALRDEAPASAPASRRLDELARLPMALAAPDRDDRRAARLEVVRAALDPMVGRSAGDDHLLVYRTVVVGRQGYRQGLVLEREQLGAWLAARALEPTGLSQVAELSFDAAGGPDAGAFVFQHRFAEPFDALTARLSLVPLAELEGVGQPGAIFWLVGLLVLVGGLGLLAVERMVALAVHFAERRNNFVSAVTHELKTPLTAIRMYAEMLRDGLVTSEAKRGEYYGTITDESERLSRLIDNVLEFSRLSRGTREMSLRVGPVGPVLQEAADKLRAHAAREGFGLEVSVEPGLPPVRYDRDALLQVLFNLVDNAMKYARNAPARRVLLEARRSDGGVELSVRDFGPGVSGRHLARIFEPFYRGEDELTRSARGTGIGLALVRELTERMGAAVRGANAEGGGFRVCLAFRAEQA